MVCPCGIICTKLGKMDTSFRFTSMGGVLVYVPLFEKDAIQRIIVNAEDFYERDVLCELQGKYIGENKVILDIGANIGNHTLYFAKVCKAKKIYSFEPIQGTFQILEKNIRINKIDDVVTAYNMAIGEGVGKASIASYNEKNIGGTQLKENDRGLIPVTSLDHFDFTNIDFVKIDVEGFECNVLKGAVNFFAANRPLVFIEVTEDNLPFVKNYFMDIDYRLEKTFGSGNYLFVPKNQSGIESGK